VYNNAEFTARDFENLSRIGQASKLDKLATTGRFGLGFNAVYHFTGDVRSLFGCGVQWGLTVVFCCPLL
jgi:hypothetical protein